MIYLSQLTLNPASRMVQREVANPYQLHRTLLTHGFGTSREESGVLHRLDVGRGGITVLVQSLVAPTWAPLQAVGQGGYLLLPPPPTKHFEATFAPGQRFHFRLRANPTVKKGREGRSQGNRVPLKTEEQQVAWLARKAETQGFRLLHAQVSGDEAHRDWIAGEAGRQQLTLYTVQFDGMLEVTNSEHFQAALQGGIGPAKAFGCGLLSLARA